MATKTVKKVEATEVTAVDPLAQASATIAKLQSEVVSLTARNTALSESLSYLDCKKLMDQARNLRKQIRAENGIPEGEIIGGRLNKDKTEDRELILNNVKTLPASELERYAYCGQLIQAFTNVKAKADQWAAKTKKAKH